MQWKALLEYTDTEGFAKSEELDVANLLATNIPNLGLSRPIDAGVAPDDGKLALSWIPSTNIRSRRMLSV
jgi:hypothetical protein